jgi:coenzyme PQQ precursor peptide PqqA
MILRVFSRARNAKDCSAVPLRGRQESIMKWETPEAIDFRFGMEITMYIANR